MPALRAYFRTQMKADYLPFGGCYTAEGYAGSAIWAPAGKPLHTGLRGPPHHGARLPVRGDQHEDDDAVAGAGREQASSRAALVPGQPGTAVDQQGKGVGGALMRPVLEHCDAEGIPCYLESSKERNLPFYRRHGFEVVEEVRLPDDGPLLWTMWREPKPPA